MKRGAAWLAAVGLLGCNLGPPAPGDTLADFGFEGVGGPGVELVQLRGQVVVINFWASWCPPCIEEMPQLEALRVALDGDPVRVISATVESIPDQDVLGFLRRHGFQGAAFRDRRWRVAHRLGTFKLPETYIVGPDGRLVRKVEGLPQPGWGDPRWTDELRRLARGEP
ncbi:MAG TPA: TlpA disulfide reductase family protein [Acidobacteriota bacterium]